MPNKMKASQISKPGGDWELVERDIPEPKPGEVLLKIEACGICHSDSIVRKVFCPFSIRGFPVTKSRGGSMRLVMTSMRGLSVSASASAGTVDTISSAMNAGAEIS